LTILILAVRYINNLAGVKETPTKDVFLQTNEDVIKYVSENEGMVGVVGELLSQPSTDLKTDEEHQRS
jgi:phosphate transport system substrate-binding protein